MSHLNLILGVELCSCLVWCKYRKDTEPLFHYFTLQGWSSLEWKSFYWEQDIKKKLIPYKTALLNGKSYVNSLKKDCTKMYVKGRYLEQEMIRFHRTQK